MEMTSFNVWKLNKRLHPAITCEWLFSKLFPVIINILLLHMMWRNIMQVQPYMWVHVCLFYAFISCTEFHVACMQTKLSWSFPQHIGGRAGLASLNTQFYHA